MTGWLLIIAVVVVAFGVFGVGLALGRRRGSLPDLPADQLGDGRSTIRSYVIPKRLGSRRGAALATAPTTPEGVAYEEARVELVDAVDGESRTWPLLKGRTRIGREPDNHIVLDDERVSAHHAQVSVQGGVYLLEDLGSTNGTFTGESERVLEPHPLQDGESLRIGGVTLVFRAE
ncbi:MAG: FHA domain-containing protein [Thermoanaerobaculia bacterium]|nr:FHA domain-containing protein [Thermoanaerobaculia bacterium]